MASKRSNSRGRVPFSWENKPGVCKEISNSNHRRQRDDTVQKLRPPPCPSLESDSAMTPLVCDFRQPLPPSLRKLGNMKLQKEGNIEDPFLAAYKECTKDNELPKNNQSGFGTWINVFGVFSCKHPTAVRDDSFVSSLASKRSI